MNLIDVIPHLKEYDKWDSLLINRRKPHTERVFRQFGEDRVCLHKFYPCSSDEAFAHPHPWPASFFIIKNGYDMEIGMAENRLEEPKYYERICLEEHSAYMILNPLTWHRISPINDEPTYTVMINGPTFEEEDMHSAVRRTKGKDLEKLKEEDKAALLNYFYDLLPITITQD